MPIADLFAPALSKPVGTVGTRSIYKGLDLSRPSQTRSGQVGTTPGPLRFVPTVPTGKEYVCARCDAWAVAREVGGFDRSGWICERCIRAAFSYSPAVPTVAAMCQDAVQPRAGSGWKPDAARMSPSRSCGNDEGERLLAAAERAVAGVVSVSDDGELLRAGDEP